MKSLKVVVAALLLAPALASAESVDGMPVVREGRLVGPVGCQFHCPAGLVKVERVDFLFRNGTGIGPRGWHETRPDDGLLVCFGDTRTVGKTQVPQIPFGIIEVTQCRVHYSRVIGLSDPDHPRECNERQLALCLEYGGGDACYEKWCD